MILNFFELKKTFSENLCFQNNSYLFEISEKYFFLDFQNFFQVRVHFYDSEFFINSEKNFFLKFDIYRILFIHLKFQKNFFFLIFKFFFYVRIHFYSSENWFQMKEKFFWNLKIFFWILIFSEYLLSVYLSEISE